MSGLNSSGRRRRLLLLAAVALLVTCGNINHLEVFYSGDVVLAPMEGQILTSITFSGFSDFDIGDTDEFQAEGYTSDQVTSAEILSLILAVGSPEGGNLDFLSEITFYAQADGLAPLEIAAVEAVPRGVDEIVFEISNSDIADHARTGSMTIVAQVLGSFPEETTTLYTRFSLDVEVDLSGSGCALTPVRTRLKSEVRP